MVAVEHYLVTTLLLISTTVSYSKGIIWNEYMLKIKSCDRIFFVKMFFYKTQP